jgi:hypothetical protein
MLLAIASLTLARRGDSQATGGGAELSVSPSIVEPGETVTIAWKGIPEPASNDWIGFFRAGSSATSSLASLSTGGSASGSTSYTVPSGLGPGEYEFRLYARGGFISLASGVRITVGFVSPGLSVSPSRVAPGGVVTLSWSGIRSPKSGDRIVLYRNGDGVSTPQGDSWGTDGRSSGSVSLTANWSPGDYQFLLFLAEQSSSSASSTLTVAPDGPTEPAGVKVAPDSVTIGESLKVTWHGVGSSASNKPLLLRVYREGTRASGTPVWQTDTTHAPSGSLNLSLGSVGTFELVLSHESVGELTSNRFTVRGVNGTRIEVTPANPTVNDEISLRIFGDWPNTCVPRDPTTLSAGSPFSSGTGIIVRFSGPGRNAQCDPVPTPWSATISLGRRAAGRYEVGVLEGLRLIASTGFTVRAFRGPANVEVTPGSPTNDKPVAVRVFGQWPTSCAPASPSATWDDTAHTLTVQYAAADGACADVVTPWSHSFERERLPAGSWRVTVLYGAEQIGGGSFAVTDPSAPSATLTVTPTEALRLQELTITWSNVPPGEHRITLGREIDDPDHDLGFSWGTNGQANGSFRYATGAVGAFVFRLHPAGQRQKVLATASFTVR